MKYAVLLLLFVALTIGLCIPAYSQTPSEHIVINEIDTNPSGDDS